MKQYLERFTSHIWPRKKNKFEEINRYEVVKVIFTGNIFKSYIRTIRIMSLSVDSSTINNYWGMTNIQKNNYSIKPRFKWFRLPYTIFIKGRESIRYDLLFDIWYVVFVCYCLIVRTNEAIDRFLLFKFILKLSGLLLCVYIYAEKLLRTL